jgi:hypothetical protein
MLTTAAAAAQAMDVDAAHPAIWQAIDARVDQHLDEEPLEARARSTGAAAAAEDALKPVSHGPAIRSSKPAPRPERWERHMPSALPFLMLRPLAAIGYLDAASATLEACGRRSDIELFAAALALKVFDPPDRGWRREALMPAVAAFAGRHEPVREPDLISLARALEDQTSPLDAVLTRSLVRGHTPRAPLLLDMLVGGLCLSEVEGLLPVCVRARVTELLPTLKELDSVVIVASRAATPEHVHELDRAGIRYVTEARPGEYRGYLDCLERDQVLWEALAARPAVPLVPESALDRSLAIAAAVALGALGWTMWHREEPTDPLLVLDRFAGFDAHLRIDPEHVRVHLPLGARYLDLQRHGWLDAIRGVPWLGGREVVFAGG